MIWNTRFVYCWQLLLFYRENAAYQYAILFLTMLSVGPGVFSPLTSAKACAKSSRWLWKESCVSTGMKKPGNTCVSQTALI